MDDFFTSLILREVFINFLTLFQMMKMVVE